MTRFAIAVMCGPAFVLSVFVGLTQGNPLAWGLAIGFAAPVVGTALILGATRPKPAPRKADPAKIRQMEHELGISAQHDPLTCAFCRVAEKAAAHSRRDDDAPTTVAAFHGAPTFGHKIEGE